MKTDKTNLKSQPNTYKWHTVEDLNGDNSQHCFTEAPAKLSGGAQMAAASLCNGFVISDDDFETALSLAELSEDSLLKDIACHKCLKIYTKLIHDENR